jgi:undecaprenyl-diphosphatase
VRPHQAALLGAAQGAAEVVPVSSSAQLVLLPWLLGWEQPVERTSFAAGLHAGSCAGIAWALRSDVRRLDRATAALLAASCVPAAVAGLAATDVVEQRLGRPPQLAALLAGAGAVLWLADRRPQRRPDVGPCAALLASLAQVAALVPGVSRSGATLIALRAAQVERAAATRFSLLMSLPVTAGAAMLSLSRARRPPWRELALGAPVAALTGALAARTQLRRPAPSAGVAALYRLGLAAVVAVRLHGARAGKGEA